MFRRVQPGHGGSAGGQLLAEVQARAPQQLGAPEGDALYADTLRQVLATQDGCRCGNRLWSVLHEARIDGRKLNEVVRQAEALLGPTRSAKIPPQEGVRSRLVQPETQRTLHLLRSLAHLIGRTRAICQEGQPAGQLCGHLRCAPAVEPSCDQCASTTVELELSAPHLPPREVRVGVAEGAEQHVLRVRRAVQRHRRIAASVDL
mmetsp:Transcript_11301/g.35937  ORF Transcript_11301/g.35937 Transcript_11301/m.35937 type:complete len:204 (-) Transcript_11301:218-829(-)